MKKISNVIVRFFRSILSFFDRFLITPITKGILRISDFFKNHSKGFDKFINNKQTLIIISLVFSFILFYVVDHSSTAIMNQSAEILYDQPVTAEYNEEAYVIEGLPETVDITLIGRSADIYLAKQYPSHEVSVDLRELKPGSHRVTLRYKQALASLDYKLDPSTATIMVYEKISKTRELTYDVLHREAIDSKLVISNIDLVRGEDKVNDVIIKGAEYKLEQVATVKALVDLNNISNAGVGTVTLRDVPLIAYDSNGQQVEVEIVPKTIDASITITSPSKEVPIQVVPVGNVVFGKSIGEIKTNISTVTIYGEQEALDKIDYLPVEINVEGLDANREYNINIERPEGVRDVSAKTIIINVTLDELVTREFKDIPIQHINLADGYNVQALSREDGMVTIIVSGSEDAINALDSSTLKATIDLDGLTAGTHKVKVTVTGGDLKLKYEPKVEEVNVRISQATR